MDAHSPKATGTSLQVGRRGDGSPTHPQPQTNQVHAALARLNALGAVLSTLLVPVILPCVLSTPDVPRVALVSKTWAAGVRHWFGADDWLCAFGLHKYFTTPEEAEIAPSMLKRIKRPSRELGAALSKTYKASHKHNHVWTQVDTTFRAGKLDGILRTFVWR